MACWKMNGAQTPARDAIHASSSTYALALSNSAIQGGYQSSCAPVGFTLTGKLFDDWKLVRAAYVLEQIGKAYQPPASKLAVCKRLRQIVSGVFFVLESCPPAQHPCSWARFD